MDNKIECRCCNITKKLASQDKILFLTENWSLNRNVDSTRTAFVLQCKRHVEHLGDLTNTEAIELSRIMPDLEYVIRKELNAERVHILLLAESDPHIHWHFIPRYRNDEDGLTGLQLLNVSSPLSEPNNLLELISIHITPKINSK